MLHRVLILLAGLIWAGSLQAADLPRLGLAAGRGRLLFESPVLSESDKNQLAEALRIKRAFGETIWPGLADAVIPFLIYNEEWQFLIGHPHPPASWKKAGGDVFEGQPYFMKPAEGNQAFAVKVGDLWAGSLDGLESMNREMEKQVKERFQDREVTPAMLQMFLQTPGQHVAALLHEAFHAFQAMSFPRRFEQALSAYTFEEDYPHHNRAFVEAWNEEGLLLGRAYAERDGDAMKSLVRQFLDLREKRRRSAGLPPQMLAFERDLEWLEGLGKYAEIRFAELAYREAQDKDRAKGYRVAFNRARVDMQSRLTRLGEQSGDLRFYLSGAVQAMLLDRLLPEWKTEFEQVSPSLEELLARAVGGSERKRAVPRAH
jgi:hypothetical protein